MEFKIGDKVWYRKRIGFRFSRVVSGTIEKLGKDRATIVGTTKKGEPFKYTTFIRNLNLKKENIMKKSELEQLIENIVRKKLNETREIKPLTSKDLETRDEDYKKAFKWWRSLSINQMKQFTKEHYPNFSYTTLPKSFLIDIWKVETK